MAKSLPPAPPAPPGSLAAALAAVPDPRRPRGWRPDRSPLPLVGLLQVAVAAMLCGARSLYAVAQWGQERVDDDAAALVPLGLPPGRPPSVATLHRVFKALDVAAFERVLGEWLAATGSPRTTRWRWTARRCAASTATRCPASIWWRPTRIRPARSWPRRRSPDGW